jgi:hypothetical protein
MEKPVFTLEQLPAFAIVSIASVIGRIQIPHRIGVSVLGAAIAITRFAQVAPSVVVKLARGFFLKLFQLFVTRYWQKSVFSKALQELPLVALQSQEKITFLACSLFTIIWARGVF